MSLKKQKQTEKRKLVPGVETYSYILSQEPRLMEKVLWSIVIIMAEEEEKLKYMLALKVPIRK